MSRQRAGEMKTSNYAIGEYTLIHGFIEDGIFDSYKEALGAVANYFEDNPDEDQVSIVYIAKRDKEGNIVETKGLANVFSYAGDPESEE